MAADEPDELRKERLFAEALELPAGERAAFVDRETGDDAALRDELRSLLETDGGATDSFLEAPPWSVDDDVPERIGPYRIAGELGRGGMGVVLRAEQEKPLRREVAVKVLRPGAATREVLARFEAERQTLARLDHPHIATIHDAGSTDDGRPFFAMELVDGVPIDEFCDARRLTVDARLALFATVCDAVQHAHQKGVVHRDLKPSNVLVLDGGTGGPVPKVIDFGIAKATREDGDGESMLTRAGQLIGTPEWMSPEQADLAERDVDTRSDVYSLGVLLYELLVGALPFDSDRLRASGFAEMNRILREEIPPRPTARLRTMGEQEADRVAAARRRTPTSLARALRADLDWIVSKSLEKDRDRRYASASELSADVRRHLSGEPVLAGAPTAAYRVSRFVGRNRIQVGAAALVLLSLVVGAIAATYNAIEVSRSRDAADRARRVAEETSRFLRQDILGAADPRALGGRGLTVREALDRAAGSIGDRYEDDATVEVAVRNTIGDTYRSLGELAPAIEQLELAVDLARDGLEEDDPVRMRAISDLAIAYGEAGRRADAEPLYVEALDVRRRVLGPNDRETLAATVNLGAHYAEDGRTDDAEELLLDALSGLRDAFGDDDGFTIVTQQHLANLYIASRRHAEARPLIEQAYEASLRVRGADHPYTLASMGSLANVLVDMGETESAELLRIEGLERATRVLGPDHYMTAQFLGAVATGLRETGRADEALPLVEEAEETARIALGETHLHTLRAQYELALVLEALGERDEAALWHDQVVEGGRAAFGGSHPELGEWLVARGANRYVAGDPDGGRDDVREGRGMLAAGLGEGHPSVARADALLAAFEGAGG
ncbi:MAG: serine/threonine-protein kinase [Planctomycetota bacterium]